MLWIGIGILFIIAGLTSIYFASQMKSEILTKFDEEIGHPYRGGKLEEFINENIGKKILTYAGILFILVGAGFIYKAVVLEVPADKIAVVYSINEVIARPPIMILAYGPGWHFINPFKVFLITDIKKINKRFTEPSKIKLERDLCLGKLSVWEQAYGKPKKEK